MKLLHVTNNLGIGGAESYLVRLCNAQVEKGYEVTLVASAPWDLREKLRKEVLVVDIPLYQQNVRPGFPKEYFGRIVVGAPKLGRLVKAMGAEIIHTHLAQSALVGWWIGKQQRLPVLHSIMHLDSAAGPWHKLLFRSGFAKHMVSAFMPFSGYSKNELSRFYGIPDSRIRLARMGIDVQTFVPRVDLNQTIRQQYGIPYDALLLGLTARLEPVKDVSLAIRVMGILSREAPGKVYLLVVGDGSERNMLEQLAENLGAARHIRFVGRLTDTREVLSSFDIYFQTTRGPNLGLAALEAMSSGVPLLIAARDLGEKYMAEDTLVEAGSGWIVDASPAALASHIFHLSRNREEVALAKCKAREVAVEHYNWQAHVDTLDRIYKDLLR